MKRFALVDVNNFFVSCERIFRPELKWKPVCTLSNNDGCIIARSQEAKDLGIAMGVPLFKVQELVKKYNVHCFSWNYTVYGELSSRFHRFLEQFSPKTEIYSIDESFIDFTTVPLEVGYEIQERCYKELGLPVCVGSASTKTLAKFANHLAKTRTYFWGVCHLDNLSTSQLEYYMKKESVGEVWGVGKRLKKSLQEIGIVTIYDLAQADPFFIHKKFSVVLAKTCRELQWESCLDFEEIKTKKSIVTSRSFGSPVASKQELTEAISYFAWKLGRKLRKDNLYTNTIIVFIASNRFQENYQKKHQTIALPEPTNDSQILISYALKAVKYFYQPGVDYKKAGILALDLQAGALQTTIYSSSRDTKRLMQTLDVIQSKYGSDSLYYACEGSNQKWLPKSQENKLKNYFSSWDEVLTCS